MLYNKKASDLSGICRTRENGMIYCCLSYLGLSSSWATDPRDLDAHIAMQEKETQAGSESQETKQAPQLTPELGDSAGKAAESRVIMIRGFFVLPFRHSFKVIWHPRWSWV